MSFDPVEAELVRQLERRREELRERAETWSRSLSTTLDPRARLRRRTVMGVVASLAPSLFGWLMPSRRGAKRAGSGGSDWSLMDMAGAVLREMGPGFLASLAASFIHSGKRAAGANSEDE